MFSFEKNENHQNVIPYEQNFDENVQKINFNNLYYPGPVIPLIEYNKDIWERLPNIIGDDGSNLEVSTLENKNEIVVELADKGLQKKKYFMIKRK